MFRFPLVVLFRVVTIRGLIGGLLVATGVLATGCGTASRPLPSRQVDDPVTLPRRMLSLSLGARGTLSNEGGVREGQEVPLRIRYGITDRITIEDLLALDVAVLDDAPSEHAATGEHAANTPVSLSLQGGIAGFGYSSSDGIIVQPKLGFLLGRRLGKSVRLLLGSTWYGSLSDGRRHSWLETNVGALVQVVDRIAFIFTVMDDWKFDRAFAPSSWSRHGLSAGPGLNYRPTSWASFSVDLQVERFFRRLPPDSAASPVFPAPLPEPRSSRNAVVWGRFLTSVYW